MKSKQQLQQLQDSGEFPTEHSDLLATKYADRYAAAKSLFEKLNSETYFYCNLLQGEEPPKMDCWSDPNMSGQRVSGMRHEGAVFGYDIDIMRGPRDWDRDQDEPEVGDFVLRKKCYLYNWTAEKIPSMFARFPELEYFAVMHGDFVPVLEHYQNECFSDQASGIKSYMYKLMVIEYSTPTATPETQVSHRKFNTERFGPDHCDETLGGLHLGENYPEFQAQNTKTAEWEFIPGLDQNHTLWMFGEHSQASGWKPTYHQMVHNPDPTLGTRYSIIFDLQARYD
jgi:hypothetical protein